MLPIRNVVSFGAALQCALREASPRALHTAITLLDTPPTTDTSADHRLLRDSLAALRAHADAFELAAALVRCHGDADATAWRNAQTLLAWLVAGARRDALICGLCRLAASLDARAARAAALAAWLVLRQRIATVRRSHDDAVQSDANVVVGGSSRVVELGVGASAARALAVRLVRDDAVALARPLADAACAVVLDGADVSVDDGAVRRRADAGHELRATRLRVAAFDALLDAAALLATVHSVEHSVARGSSTAATLGDAGAEALLALLDALLRCLPEVRLWSERPRPLQAFALERLERLLRAVRALEPRDAALDLAVYHLAFFAPYAASDTALVQPSGVAATVQRLLDDVYHPLQPLAGAASDDELQAEAEERSYRSCLAVCLALGHLNERRLRDALQNVPAARLLDVAVGQFHGQSQNATARIAAQLATLAIGVVKKSDALALLEPLTELLKSSLPPASRTSLLERDNVADATALLLARVIGTIETPGALRGALVPLLEDGDDKVQAAMRRHNAILLLEHLLSVIGDAPPADAPLALELAHVLLDRLGDDQVQLRAAAARLFGRLDSAFVVPELVRRALSRDVRLRSAAEQAVLEHMQRVPPSQLPAALVVLLQAAGAPEGDDVAAGDIGARVLRTLPQWLGALTLEQGGAVVRQCVETALAMPRSAIGSRLLAGVLLALPQHAVSTAATLCRVLDSQGEVTAEALEAVADSADQLAEVLFARVAPLLLLRALPARALLDVDDAALVLRLRAALCARIDSPFEFDQVRKLAAEVLARLPPALVFDTALGNVLDEHLSLDVQKAYLFAVLNALVVGDRHGAVPSARVLDVLLAVFARPVSGAQVEQLQRGAIECLACLCNVSLGAAATPEPAKSAMLLDDEPTPSALHIVGGAPVRSEPRAAKRGGAALIVELGGSAPATLVESLLERMLDERDALQVRVCVGNALILLAGMCGEARRARCFGGVVNGALRGLRTASASLVPVLLQLLFAWVFHGGALVAPFGVELVQTALQQARRSESGVRFGGVKLLGALLSNAAIDALFGGEHSPLADVSAALSQVASDTRSDAATRELANQLAGALTTAP